MPISAARGVVTAGMAGLGVLALGACQPDNTAQVTPPPHASAAPTSKPSTAPTVQPSAAPSAPPAAGQPVNGTQPGTVLRIGRPATLPWTGNGKAPGTVTMTVTGIEKGKPSDLAPLNLGQRASGLTPYYIRFTMKNAGNADLSYASPTQWKGLFQDGTQAQDQNSLVVITTRFPKCPWATLPGGFGQGASMNGCFMAFAAGTGKIVGAEWWAAPYSLYKGGVIWK